MMIIIINTNIYVEKCVKKTHLVTYKMRLTQLESRLKKLLFPQLCSFCSPFSGKFPIQ